MLRAAVSQCLAVSLIVASSSPAADVVIVGEIDLPPGVDFVSPFAEPEEPEDAPGEAAVTDADAEAAEELAARYLDPEPPQAAARDLLGQVVPHRRHLRHASFATANLEHEVVDRTEQQQVPEIYPASHPLVARALTSMHGLMGDLKVRQQEASRTRDEMQGSEEKAVFGMQNGQRLRRIMASRQTEAYIQGRQLKQLEAEKQQLEEKHGALAAKLRAIMDRRIAAAQRRLDRKQAAAAKVEGDVEHWNELQGKYRTSALESLQERRQTEEDLKATEEGLKQVQQRQEDLTQKYEEVRSKVNHNIEAYKFAQTKFEASKTQAAEDAEAASLSQGAMDQQRNILKEEEDRLDASFAVGERKLQERIRKAGLARSKAEQTVQDARQSYAEWQAAEKRRAEEAETLKRAYDEKQQAFEAGREQLLDAAQSKVGEHTATESDFDAGDWAWSSAGERGIDGEDVEEVHLS